MRLRFFFSGLLGLVVLARGQSALACGGCFHEEPPPMMQMQSITVVTDHRMAFAVSPSATTLYDQIRYQGDPSAFAWVLPIAGTVDVGLSADVLFGTLDALTQTTLTAPIPPACPAPPICDYGFGRSSGGGCSCGGSKHALSFAGSDGASTDDDDGGGALLGAVEVTKHEVVGPYDTVQLTATDPMAIDTWLAMNGFAIPDDVKPVLAAYQKEGFGFLALKLLPGKGVSSMRPVRVTSKGAGLGLPLRMVSAGTGANVGITLWIVAEGRYEPSNFTSFRIGDDELVWDWNTQSSNYVKLRADKTAASQGAAWELESSLDLARSAIEKYILSGGAGFGTAPAVGDYLPIMDANGKTTKTPDEARQDDLDALLAGMRQSGRVTRFRADLARSALVKDLQLTASNDQGQLTNARFVKNDVNRPPCPIYPPCPTPVPNETARGGSTCSTTNDPEDWSSAGIAIATAVITASMIRRRRRSSSASS